MITRKMPRFEIEASRTRYADPFPVTAAAETDWMRDGICKEIGWQPFFAAKGAEPTEARRICSGCPVTDTCREYAIVDPEIFGVWGGTTFVERQAERVRRAEQARRDVA